MVKWQLGPGMAKRIRFRGIVSMRKQIWGAILVLALILGIAGCGGPSADEPGTDAAGGAVADGHQDAAGGDYYEEHFGADALGETSWYAEIEPPGADELIEGYLHFGSDGSLDFDFGPGMGMAMASYSGSWHLSEGEGSTEGSFLLNMDLWLYSEEFKGQPGFPDEIRGYYAYLLEGDSLTLWHFGGDPLYTSPEGETTEEYYFIATVG